MKNVLLCGALILLMAFQSCNETKANSGKIEMVTPLELYEAVYSGDNSQLVDVRTDEEYQVSHLKDAQNFCVTDESFKEQVADLDKNKPVYVYCRSGKRSHDAANILIEMGFTKVYDLQGGHINWKEEGLETVE
jgi:rhodanese-related sulfurtransferase